MKTRSNFSQRGVSITGLVFILAILGALAVLAMKVVPTVTEFISIKKAVATAKASGSTPAEIRLAFDKQADVAYIESIAGKDLEITATGGGGHDVSFAYDKKIALFGPASLLLEYEGTTAVAAKGKKRTPGAD